MSVFCKTLLLVNCRGCGTGLFLAEGVTSSKELHLLRIRGFGAGVCNVGLCSKAAEAVARVGVEIHAKEEEKNYMQEKQYVQNLRHAWIIRSHNRCLWLVCLYNYMVGKIRKTYPLLKLYKTTKYI